MVRTLWIIMHSYIRRATIYAWHTNWVWG
jgi:hypothetical protein